MSQSKTPLPTEIKALLSKLRSRIRLYVWAEGVAALILLFGVVFWAGLLIDWVFEPSPTIRLGALIALAAAALLVAYRFIFRRAFVRLSDANMANLLERKFDQFQDSLVTSVELAESSDHSEPFSDEMLDQTSRGALRQIEQVPLWKVLNFRPLLSKAVLAAVLVSSIVAFGAIQTEAFGFWLQRISLNKELWPRKTHLLVEGFAEVDGVRVEKVARDGKHLLVVKAEKSSKVIPDVVQIRYRYDNGTGGHAAMTRIGRATRGKSQQEYQYAFESVASPLSFDVVGGDARVRGLRLEVVERPQITQMTLKLEYPDYMRRSPQEVAVTGAMQIPAGTKITIQGNANKELHSIKAAGIQDAETISLDLTKQADRREFRLEIPPLSEHKVIMFRLVDTDEIENLEPYRLALNVAPDEPPQVAIQLQGIGSAITPLARLNVAGDVTDDHALDSVAFEYSVDENPPQTSPIGRQGSRANEIEVDAALDLRDLPEDQRLQPKQRLSLSIKATDYYDLDGETQSGQSQRFVLQVVSPEQLQLMLQKRELELRRRFETIYADMVDTRDLLARVDFRQTNSQSPETEEKPVPSSPERAADLKEDSASNPKTTEEQSPERELARRKLRIMRALQNVERAAHETLAVAEGFDGVYLELVNNRIDTEELKDRLQNEISAPLKAVSGERLPGLEKKIRELEKSAGDTSAGPDLLRRATLEADEVLVEMKSILDRMLELEDYNEVLELLRDLIQEQDDLNSKTRKLRREQLRGLLEE